MNYHCMGYSLRFLFNSLSDFVEIWDKVSSNDKIGYRLASFNRRKNFDIDFIKVLRKNLRDGTLHEMIFDN